MSEFEKRINLLVAKKKNLEKELSEKKEELQYIEKEREAAEEALEIEQEAAKRTQKGLEYHFSDIVTSAMHTVFPNPYTFVPEFVERRNKTECDLWFERDGKRRRPRFASGGGTKDVASFALRTAYWRLEKTSPIFIADEPFRNLSKNYMEKAVDMLRMLADKYENQMIIVTHIKEIVDAADKVFHINEGEIIDVEEN